MVSQLDQPDHFRSRAEELRAVAEMISEPTARANLLKLANDYDKLASRAEERIANRARPYSSSPE